MHQKQKRQKAKKRDILKSKTENFPRLEFLFRQNVEKHVKNMFLDVLGGGDVNRKRNSFLVKKFA